MAKKNKQEETIVDVQEVYSKTEVFINKNRKIIAGTIGIAALAILAFFIYQNKVVAPTEADANNVIWKAEQYMEVDSLDLAIYGDGIYPGFEDVIAEHPGTKAEKRAHYWLGIINRDRGEFETALDHFQKADFSDDAIGFIAMGNVGDMHIELGDYQKGAEMFEKVAKMAQGAESASFNAPLYFNKAGIAYLALDNKVKAKEMFKVIQDNYPDSKQFANAVKYASSLRNAK